MNPQYSFEWMDKESISSRNQLNEEKERDTKDFFSKIIRITKIPEKNYTKTPDFSSEEFELEVKSINTSLYLYEKKTQERSFDLGLPKNESDQILKISEKIGRCLEKSWSEKKLKIAIIYCDAFFSLEHNFYDNLKKQIFIEQIPFKNTQLDGIVFVINIFKNKNFGPIAWSKNLETEKLFKKLNFQTYLLSKPSSSNSSFR